MTEPGNPWWQKVTGPELAQGDMLSECLVPEFAPNYGADEGRVHDVPAQPRDCIVMTQSCDLASGRSLFVALCPFHTLSEWEQTNPEFAGKAKWENVRKGRFEGLHLLASPIAPNDNRQCLVVDFRQIYSLPLEYLAAHADTSGERWRLKSPFLEHLSQAFARFFMRVGLPSAIPEFR